MDNILSFKGVIDGNNPGDMLKGISVRVRARRLERNLTQAALAARSGVSLGTLKRFEHTGEISLKHLLMLAVVLDCTDNFSILFTERKYRTFDEAVAPVVKEKKRGRIND